jgi:tRNA(Ile)-lysidine synthase
MHRLGPFEPSPALAVAVSGGADSMALALLTRDWVRRHAGSVTALVVDHGLRAAAGAEALLTVQRLAAVGIQAQLLALRDLRPGSGLAERARLRRYEALGNACVKSGILHLLLGHHAADQRETLAMRVLRGSRTHGLTGMASLRETATVRLLRPLLGIEPTSLQRYLVAHGIAWVEDPSNQDQCALRARLRLGLGAAERSAPAISQALASVGALREREEAAAAGELAERATIRPEGFALLSFGRIGAAALGSLVRTIGGACYKPNPAQIADLAARPRPATMAGVRVLPAGRLGDGLLVVREEAAIGEPVAASDGVVWDNRFRLIAGRSPPAGAMIGRLGHDAAKLRGVSDLPSAVLRTLPAVRVGGVLASVPNIGYACHENDRGMTLLFNPEEPVAGACFVPRT